MRRVFERAERRLENRKRTVHLDASAIITIVVVIIINTVVIIVVVVVAIDGGPLSPSPSSTLLSTLNVLVDGVVVDGVATPSTALLFSRQAIFRRLKIS